MSTVLIGEKEIPIDPQGFGMPYQELYNRTELTGWELWLLYSHNNFQNPFAEANEVLYDRVGWWAVIVNDKIIDSGKETKGFLPVTYMAGRKKIKLKAPKSGWICPTRKGWFQKGTLIPFSTGTREEAISEIKKLKQPIEQVSYFYRNNTYAGKGNDRFVGRSFYPLLNGGGRFLVDANWLPSISGYGRVASFPRVEENEIVMDVKRVIK